MVPFYPFFGYGFPYDITNPKKGALMIIWLPGYQVGLSEIACLPRKETALPPLALGPIVHVVPRLPDPKPLNKELKDLKSRRLNGV